MELKQLLSQERDRFIEERSLDAKQPDMELIPKSDASEVHCPKAVLHHIPLLHGPF